MKRFLAFALWAAATGGCAWADRDSGKSLAAPSGGPSGVVPAGGTVQTQYRSGGAPAPGTVGPISAFNRPTVAPASGGADCDH